MNQILITAQRMRWLILITIIGLLAFGYFLQYVEGLAPCPLCITQRFFFFLLQTLASTIVKINLLH